MKKAFKSVKGFTLVELMVVIIIVGILAAVAVPLYKDYVNKGKASEGQALVGAVAAAEKVYFAQHNQCLSVGAAGTGTGGGGAADPLGVVATENIYFTAYDVQSAQSQNSCDYTITTIYNGTAVIKVTLTQANGVIGAQPVVTVNGVVLN